MTHHQSNGHCKVRSLIHRVKCDCSVQRIGTNRAVSAALHTPRLGGPTLSQRAQNSVLSPLSTPEKASISQIEIRSARNQWIRGPFERKVHYSYFGPLWKQDIFTLQLLSGAPLKAN